MKSSVDCNFRLDLSVSGCSIVVRYLDSWYVREPQKETICCDADCRVEAILLLMLSLVDSDSSLCRDRAASTLDTITSVGIRFGVTVREFHSTMSSNSVGISCLILSCSCCVLFL